MTRNSETPRQFQFNLVTLFGVVTLLSLLMCMWNPLGRTPKRANLPLIEPGMTVSEVAALVGPPDQAVTYSDNVRFAHEYQLTHGEEWRIVYVDGRVVMADRIGTRSTFLK
jgi:hypothetical protein